jgi:protease-4
MRAWEIALAALFLALCLIGGLYLDRNTSLQQLAGGGANIGLVRFDSAIDFESADAIITLLEAARQDDSVSAVVLELLSPGGFATSSESIFYTLLRLREEKPLVVVIDGLAASGGYYMAAAANRILAPSSAYVGNVGTRGGRPADPAIAPDELSSGPYKLEGGSRFDQIQQLDLVAQAFLQNVAAQRAASAVNPLKLTLEELGEARLYLGSEALALGLIDAEGGRTDGIMAAAELAGVEDYQVVELAPYLGFFPPEEEDRSVQSGVAEMVAQAPPGTIYMLDSRIPLPAAALPRTRLKLSSKRGGDALLGGAQAPAASAWAGSLLRSTPEWTTTP